MDFKRNFNDGYKDSAKDLPMTKRAFMHGYKDAYNEVSNFLEDYDSCYDIVSEDAMPTLSRIEKEIREKTINDLKDWLERTWYELMVSFIDNLDDDKKDEWDVPEPLDEE